MPRKNTRTPAQKQAEKRDRATLRQAAKAGVYKGDASGPLTESKRKKAAALRRQYGADALDPTKTVVVAARRDVPRAIKQAQDAGLQTTTKAIFVPKDEGVTRASLAYDREDGFTLRTKIRREGETGTRYVTRTQPLMLGTDDEKLKARLQYEIRRASKGLKENERLVYRLDIHERGAGYGRYMYGGEDTSEMTDEELAEYLEDEYEQMMGDIRKRYALKTEIIEPMLSIEKTTVEKHLARNKRTDESRNDRANQRRRENRRQKYRGNRR